MHKCAMSLLVSAARYECTGLEFDTLPVYHFLHFKQIKEKCKMGLPCFQQRMCASGVHLQNDL